MLLTYDDYKSLGGEIAEIPFLRLAIRAENAIHLHTFSRLKGISEPSMAVKACMCDLIELFETDTPQRLVSKSNTAGSESQSESYAQVEITDRVGEIVQQYLQTETTESGTPLLERSCRE